MPVSKLASMGNGCLGSGLPGGGAKVTSMAQQFTRSAMRPVCSGAEEKPFPSLPGLHCTALQCPALHHSPLAAG